MICYLSYALLIILKQYLQKLNMSPEKALQHLDSMYKVYMKDTKNKFKISRVVTLTKIQKDILNNVFFIGVVSNNSSCLQCSEGLEYKT
jgi:hypothetical protein